MSVWKRVESKIFEKKVDKKMFEETLLELEIGLDYGVKEVANAWGKDVVDAALINLKSNNTTALGVYFNKKGGVELVGDIYGSGFGLDGRQDTLLNKMSQTYQKNKMLKALKSSAWNIEDVITTNTGEIKIEIGSY